MRLVIGRGNNRKVYDLAPAQLLRRAKFDSKEVETYLANVREKFGFR